MIVEIYNIKKGNKKNDCKTLGGKSQGTRKHDIIFYVLLTVHPNMIVFFFQLDAHILYFNTFITFLYIFRALLFSSSGGQLY